MSRRPDGCVVNWQARKPEEQHPQRQREKTPMPDVELQNEQETIVANEEPLATMNTNEELLAMIPHQSSPGSRHAKRRKQCERLLSEHRVVENLVTEFETYSDEVGDEPALLAASLQNLSRSFPETFRSLATGGTPALTLQKIVRRVKSLKSPQAPPPPPPETNGQALLSVASARKEHNDRCKQTANRQRGRFLGENDPKRTSCEASVNQSVNSPGFSPSCVASPKEVAAQFPFADMFGAPGSVDMRDITEDGMPPDQRASEASHVRLAITIKSVGHLPKLDSGLGKCDPFIELSFFDCTWQTTKRKLTYDATFEESFCVFVHSENVAAALDPDMDVEEAAAGGLMLEFTCYDYDMFGSNEIVGHSHIMLKDLLSCPDGTVFERNLYSDGEMVYGFDRMATTMTISAARVQTSSQKRKWVAPSLEVVLEQSDGAGVLSQVFSSDARSIGALAPKTIQYKFLPAKKRWASKGEQSSQIVMDEANEQNQRKDVLDSEVYWRERLEIALETLSVNIVILLLVLIDVINVLVTILGSGEDTVAQMTITFVVLSFFLVELSLRMMAQEMRFWKLYWNIFDVVVIYASVGFAIGNFVLTKEAERTQSLSVDRDAQTLDTAKTASTPLRIFSRVAMGLRVLRVLMHIRKVNRLQGHVASSIRAFVSQNKRRYTNQGYDLDLTYITDRVIAMSAPALGEHSVYRNDIHVVSRFLSSRHYASFFVFNLCDTFVSSDGAMGNYHAQMFFNQMQRIPFEDHCPPLLMEMIEFCREATAWMRCNPANVIAVHCKGGKGRTGVMIAAFLLWIGFRKCALDAMELFTFRRTNKYDPEQGLMDNEDEDEDVDRMLETKGTWRKLFEKKAPPNRGVDGPSQQRYVFYIEAMLYCGIDPLCHNPLMLTAMKLMPGTQQEKEWHVSYTVRCQRTMVFDSFQGEATAFSQSLGNLVLPIGIQLNGDTKIELWRHKRRKNKTRKLMWFIMFHPAFYEGKTEIVFTKKKIDMLHKDKKNKIADDTFALTLYVKTLNESVLKSLDTSKKLDPTHTGPEPDFSFFEVEAETARLFRTLGKQQSFHQGQYLLDKSSPDGQMMMIEDGIVEAVVQTSQQSANRGQHASVAEYHPCGTPIPKSGSKKCERTPIHMIQGRGAIIGLSNFLSAPRTLFFRARTDVTVYVLKRLDGAETEAKTEAPECPSPSGADLGTSEDTDDEDPQILANLPKGANIQDDSAPAKMVPSKTEHSSSARNLSMKLFNMEHSSSMKDLWGGRDSVFNRSRRRSSLGSNSSLSDKSVRAWLVQKRLNVVQTWWRSLVVDLEQGVIINKALHRLNTASAVVDAPKVQHAELLHGRAVVRKVLKMADIMQVIQYHNDSSKVTIKFKTEQRPYKIEFLDATQRKDFIRFIGRVVPPSNILVRKPPISLQTNLRESEFQIKGIPVTILATFYHGVALRMAHLLDQTRTECIRISRLRALSDTESLKLMYDDGEQLRLER